MSAVIVAVCLTWEESFNTSECLLLCCSLFDMGGEL